MPERFQCDFCGRYFASEDELYGHQEISLADYPGRAPQ
jgi:hypothetical protein